MTREQLIQEISQLPARQKHVLLALWQAMLEQLFGSISRSAQVKANADSLLEAFLNLSSDKFILGKLTPEDLEVLHLRAEGMNVNEIADEIGVDPKIVRFRLAKVHSNIRARVRRSIEETNRMTEEGIDRSGELTKTERDSRDKSQLRARPQEKLSQRLHGILTFDRDPPNDEEVKDMIADYMIRKYS